MKQAIPDIRFYDFNFKTLHVENHFTSSNWSIYYNDIGTFEAHFDLESDALPVIMDNPYLVAVQGDLAAIIVGKKISTDLTIFGRTCNWLLTKRVTDPFALTSGTVGNIVSDRVLAAFSDVIEFIKVTGDADSVAISAGRNDKCETFKFVQETLAQAHLGHEVNYDPIDRHWEFKILRSVKKNLIISTANRNAFDVTMDSDILDYCSEGWYKEKMVNMGDWDPNTNKVTVNGSLVTLTNENAANYGKYWTVSTNYTGTHFGITGFTKGDYLVCRRLDNNGKGIMEKSNKADVYWVKIQKQPLKLGIYRWDSLLSGGSESEALAALENERIVQKIQGKTINVKFGKFGEYDIGDIVLVQHQTGAYKHHTKKRIIGVNLWYEYGNIGEEPVFEDFDETEE